MSVAGASLSYDTNFDLTGTAGFSGTYDVANRLVLAHSVASAAVPSAMAAEAEFVYDGLGRCVKRTINNVVSALVRLRGDCQKKRQKQRGEETSRNKKAEVSNALVHRIATLLPAGWLRKTELDSARAPK